MVFLGTQEGREKEKGEEGSCGEHKTDDKL